MTTAVQAAWESQLTGDAAANALAPSSAGQRWESSYAKSTVIGHTVNARWVRCRGTDTTYRSDLRVVNLLFELGYAAAGVWMPPETEKSEWLVRQGQANPLADGNRVHLLGPVQKDPPFGHPTRNA